MLLMDVNNNFASHIWEYILMGLLALTGVGLVVYKFIKKRKDKRNLESRMKPHEDSDGSLSIVVEHLKDKVDNFSGNFSSLQNLVDDGNFDVEYAGNIFENVINVFKRQCDKEVNEWFSLFVKDRDSWTVNLYRDKAKQLMDVFARCGVVAAGEKELDWSDKAASRYNRLFHVNDGERCEIMAPCWMLGGRVIEKGVVKPQKAGEGNNGNN